MHILVLDTIHGGTVIGEAFASAGHTVDCVDVYRNTTPEAAQNAAKRTYDLVVAPVHLDPDHPLLRQAPAPVITHHEAVRLLLDMNAPVPMIEITGAQGKTTTAHALAHLMTGPGVIHTSTGTYEYPERRLLWKKSITPASVLAATRYARLMNGWLIAEESLGVTGAGCCAIITSPEDYRCAAGKRSALAHKIQSAQKSPHLLLAPGIPVDARAGVIHLEDVASCTGQECRITYGGAEHRFSNPLLELTAYKTPLALAATTAVLLGIPPTRLETFRALDGRLHVQHEAGLVIVDNANSGTNATTTIEAARYARACAGMQALTLVIGTVEGDGAVCEGFPPDQISHAIHSVQPEQVIWVGKNSRHANSSIGYNVWDTGLICTTLAHARQCAIDRTKKGSIVLAVKTWR
ncbi:MAG: coenzyme F430 synthase [Methanoregula sp.]|nr:coenzyme F430 synthase [Methanoregula sp.]